MIRRVLAAPINADHPQRGLEEALAGIFGADNVLVYDYLERHREWGNQEIVNARLRQAAREFEPDWIWLQLQDLGTIFSETILRLREENPSCVVTHWTGDMRPTVSPYMAAVSRATHVTFASSWGQLPDFIAAGAPQAHYLQIGLDFTEDVLGLPEWEPPFRVPDVVFCGGHYGGSFQETHLREQAILALVRAGIDVGVVGGGWPAGFPVVGSCGVKQQHHVWKRAKVGLNVNHFNSVRGYYSDRQLIAMASGTPLVCRYVPGIELEFQQARHCMWFENETEIVSYVGELLGNEPLRVEMGREGRAEVIRHHTWHSRILHALPVIEDAQRRLA